MGDLSIRVCDIQSFGGDIGFREGVDVIDGVDSPQAISLRPRQQPPAFSNKRRKTKRFCRICGRKSHYPRWSKRLDFPFPAGEMPLGSEQVPVHRGSLWLCTCPRCFSSPVPDRGTAPHLLRFYLPPTSITASITITTTVMYAPTRHQTTCHAKQLRNCSGNRTTCPDLVGATVAIDLQPTAASGQTTSHAIQQ